MTDGPLLLVKTHAFGDAMLCMPAVRELLRGLDGGREAWALAGPSSAPAWERLDGIARTIRAPFPAGGAAGLAELAAWTLGHLAPLHRCSSVVVFHVDPRVRRWVRTLTGAPSRSCGAVPLGSWEEVFPMRPGEFAGRSYSRAAGVEPVDWSVPFPVTAAEAAWADALGIPPGTVAIAPGGGRNPRDDVPEKRWPAERFARTAAHLAAGSRGILLAGGPDDAEAASVVAASAGSSAIDLTGRADWGRTAAAISRCSAFLGADSGPAHLAAALGVPAVVLFGPTSPDALYAEGSIVPVTGGKPCSPCYASSVFPGCRAEGPPCMESIAVESVIDALERVLDEDHRR